MPNKQEHTILKGLHGHCWSCCQLRFDFFDLKNCYMHLFCFGGITLMTLMWLIIFYVTVKLVKVPIQRLQIMTRVEMVDNKFRLSGSAEVFEFNITWWVNFVVSTFFLIFQLSLNSLKFSSIPFHFPALKLINLGHAWTLTKV